MVTPPSCLTSLPLVILLTKKEDLERESHGEGSVVLAAPGSAVPDRKSQEEAAGSEIEEGSTGLLLLLAYSFSAI